MLAKRIIPCLDVTGGRVVKELILLIFAMREIRWKSRAVMMNRAQMN